MGARLYLILGDNPGVWTSCADVSEQSQCSIFIVRFFLLKRPMDMEQNIPKSLAHTIQMQGNHPKPRIWHSQRGEILISGRGRNVMKTNLLIPLRKKEVVRIRTICNLNIVRTNVVCVLMLINHLTPELNPSAQRCLPRFFYWGF
jgi:hypothetical protein